MGGPRGEDTREPRGATRAAMALAQRHTARHRSPIVSQRPRCKRLGGTRSQAMMTAVRATSRPIAENPAAAKPARPHAPPAATTAPTYTGTPQQIAFQQLVETGLARRGPGVLVVLGDRLAADDDAHPLVEG